MIIDAHQHFWRIGENDCTWPTPDLTAIYRNFETTDLEAVASPLGVIGSVLLQTQESDRDTDWMLALAAEAPCVKAVVGWVDLAAPGATERIVQLARAPKFRGLRPMLQSSAQDDWITQPSLAPAIEVMTAHEMSFDALVFTRHLPALRVFAARHPTLQIVIDHAAKPPIALGQLDPWREEMVAIARLPNVWCKFSGLLTEAAPAASSEALQPYVSHLVNIFGASRLMWGSDWPVLLLASDYARWLNMARDLTGFKGAEQDQAFGGVARAFYRL
ncbi:MAG: amidohydrolase family protein [Terricaulis silvestris]